MILPASDGITSDDRVETSRNPMVSVTRQGYFSTKGISRRIGLRSRWPVFRASPLLPSLLVGAAPVVLRVVLFKVPPI